jgi:hypothetical protein
MAKKKKPNKLGHEYVGVVSGKNIYRDSQNRFTDEQGDVIAEKLPGYAKFLITIFPEVYESGEKQRTVTQEQQQKAANEEKRDKEEAALQLQSIEDYIRDNNAILKEQLAELAQSSTILSEISEKIGKLTSGNSISNAISGLSGVLKTLGNLRKTKPGGAKPFAGKEKPGGVKGAKVPPEENVKGKGSKLRGAGRTLGRAMPIIGGALTAGEIYGETGNVGQAAAAGGGAIAGGVAGAELGAAAGLLGGPLAWATVPIGSLLGGAAGATLGSEYGQKLFGYNKDSKETEAIKEAKQRGSKNQNVITFKADEIRFNAQRMTFDVQRLTIETKDGQSSMSGSVGGGGKSDGGANAQTQQSGFNPSIKTPSILGTEGGTGAYSGFTGASPTTQSVKSDMAKAMSFRPAGEYAASSSGNNLKQIIDAAAVKAGIDPRIMYGIVAGESLHGNAYDIGDNGKSFGPFQMYMGGGLGNTFNKQTGLDVRNPASLPQQAEWIANFLAKTPGGIRNWHGYRGNVDWNPSWGSMGFQQPAKIESVETKPVSATKDIPSSLLSGASIGSMPATLSPPEAGAGFNLSLQTGTGMTLDARKAATDVGEKLKGRGGASFENTEPGFSGQIGKLVPSNESSFVKAFKKEAASRDFSNFDWSFGEAPPSDVPLRPISDVLNQTAEQTQELLSDILPMIVVEDTMPRGQGRKALTARNLAQGIQPNFVDEQRAMNEKIEAARQKFVDVNAGAYGGSDYGTWNADPNAAAYQTETNISNLDRYRAAQEESIRGILPKPSTEASAIDPETGLRQAPGQVSQAAKLYPISPSVQAFGSFGSSAFGGGISTPQPPKNPPLVSRKIDKHVDSKTAKPKQPGIVGDDDMIRRVFEILGAVAIGAAAYQGLHHRIGRGRR